MRSCIIVLAFILLQTLCQSCSKAKHIDLSNKVIDVVIMAGQSNMEGGNRGSYLTNQYLQAIPNALIYAKSDSGSTSAAGVEPLLYSVNNNWRSVTLSSCGPEISMAYDYTNSENKKLGIIKYSLAGSRLVDDGIDTASYGLWDVDAPAARAGAWGNHYKRLVQNFVIPGLQAFKNAGYTPHIRALIWVQGETDAITLYCASNYAVKFEQLTNQFKTDLFPYDTSVNSMHVIISRTNNHLPPSVFAYLNTIRTAQQNAASYFGSYGHLLTTTDDYAMESDNIHFSKPGQIQQGLDISSLLKKIIPYR